MKVTPIIVAAAAALSCIATAIAETAAAPCREPRMASERIVCTNPQLGHLDERMGRYYGWLVAVLDERQKAALGDEQRLFLAFRDACGSDVACLRASYLTRIDDLARRLRRLTTEARLTP